VWLSSGQANQTTEIQLVKDYLAHDIPVGGVEIDSQWSTADNNFVFDTKKYPDAQGMISFFHSLNIRVVLWATSFLNTDAPTFGYAKSKGYLLNGGKTIKWWHGEGGLIDYSNPDAANWWHQQLDLVMDIGVDANIFEYVVAYGHKGPQILISPSQRNSVDVLILISFSVLGVISHREYADYYYRDFWYYPKSKNPNALLWARPCDSYGSPICLQFAPHDVMHSGWVGDQKGNWDGIKAALFNMIHSAWQNFASYGSDIGGYLNGDNTQVGRTKELFIRWAQMGAFTPHMENGGNGEHRPWMFDVGNSTQIGDIYRNFVHIHQELIPYFLSAGTAALGNKTSVMIPSAPKTDVLSLSTYDYKLWHDIFVSPITNGNYTSQKVVFPKGDNWIDWWNPSKVYQGGSTVNYPISTLESFPVFQRQGSILPINVTREFTGHGSKFSDDTLTLLISGIDVKRQSAQAVVRGELPDGISQEISYEYVPASGTLRLTATAHTRNVLVLLRSIKTCGSLSVQNNIFENPIMSIGDSGSGMSLQESTDISELLMVSEASLDMQAKLRRAQEGFWFDSDRSELWIRPGASDYGVDVTISCISNN
jgi:hypothetical protein